LTLLAVARRPLASAAERVAWVPAYAIGATAMFWTLERVVQLG
jgi:hypothetical protein